ncbi:MAG TPA: endonuclease/exonuclease/phosphatase family protein [Blastocatellia bacterium]|nr:endonuclease/exonuclease/phosphatase family protein [Blastocatellia bacterium]
MMKQLWKLLPLGIVIIGVCSVLGYFGRWQQWLELANHFRLQYLLGALLLLLLLLIGKRWRWSIVAAAFVTLNAVHILPWYFASSTTAAVAGQRLKLLQSNVKYSNREYDRLFSYVQEEAPDIVTLSEIDQAWADALTMLKATYPYAQVEPSATGSGLALFSKIKLESTARENLGLIWRPGIHATFNLAGRLVHLVTIHPPTPTEPPNYVARNAQFAAVVQRMNELPAPKILIGDFNDTVWSSYHAEMLRQTGLVNVRKGYGLLPSWPAWLGIAPLMIPIDHCLVSPDVEVLSVRSGKNIGSDHLPLVVELAVPPQK